MSNVKKPISVRGVGKKPLGESGKKISQLETENIKAINSAPLTEKVSDEFDRAPKFSASEIIERRSEVEDIYSKDAKGDQHFAVYLNRYEVTAMCLLMDAYDLESRNHVMRRFGLTKAIEVAETKLGMNEEICQEFYRSGKYLEYSKKKATSRR